MVGGYVGEHKQRRLRPLVRDRAQRLIEIEMVGLLLVGRTHLVLIDEVRDAGGQLEAPRGQEGARARVERDRLVATARERARQPAFDPVGRNPCDVELEPAEGTRR